MSRRFKEREQVYAVLRADLYHDPETEIEHLVTVKEIVHDLETAEAEVARLNALRPDGKVRYWWQMTRLYPAGTSAGGDPDPDPNLEDGSN